MHAKVSDRFASAVVAALIVGLMAHTCIFTPTRPIASGQRATLSAAGTPVSPILNKRDGKASRVEWLEPAIGAWSAQLMATDSLVCPSAADIVHSQFHHAPLCPRPPPLAL